MSEEGRAEHGAPAGKARGGMIAVAAVAALLGGGAAGAFALGPMLAGRGHAAESSGGAHGSKGGGGHGGGDASTVFSIDNLVVNPAGTQGTRFLIATVAVEAKDAGAAAELNARDPEIRDMLLGLLSRRTVDELADLNGRDVLKDEIRAAIETVVGSGGIVRVFIPQYVLQ